MKDLNTYIKEGLFDDLDKIDGKKGLESGIAVLKQYIIDWLCENCRRYSDRGSRALSQSNISVNMRTTPPTVNYNGSLAVVSKVSSINNDGMFQWGKVRGDFNCAYCPTIKNLEGCPKEVGKDFMCNDCPSLETLEGAPKKVGGSFNCQECNLLENLEGAPEVVGGGFVCAYCKNLKTLKGAPKEVGGFYCQECYSLKTLDGAPKIINGDLNCSRCTSLESLGSTLDVVTGNFRGFCNVKLKSLKGSPKEIKEFTIWGCDSLTSLEGGPEKATIYTCYNCKSLTTLKGAPKEVENTFDCSNTNIENLEGAPEKLLNLLCTECSQLTSLKGCPHVTKSLYINSCSNLKSLEYIPLQNEYVISMYNTPIEDVGDLKKSKAYPIYGYERCPAEEDIKEHILNIRSGRK